MAAKKANGTLGVIPKGTENKTENIITPLYRSLCNYTSVSQVDPDVATSQSSFQDTQNEYA